MNLLIKVCRELGVEVGEEWLGNDGKTYTINQKGSIFEVGHPMLVETTQSNWKRVISGELEPVWEPKNFEDYCVPDPMSKTNKYRYNTYHWMGDDYDKWALANKMVYRTKEEAIEVANQMLEAIKNEAKE